ncbi:MAG: hypothetical protein LAP21_09365 [Acidobacteriia bacterium]|nr:hypothetical protein [Terriglobia bacterium]
MKQGIMAQFHQTFTDCLFVSTESGQEFLTKTEGFRKRGCCLCGIRIGKFTSFASLNRRPNRA